jgi:Rod binding domain-containing protein
MSDVGSLLGLGGVLAPHESAGPRRTKHVAREFESLLIAQLMRSMRGGEQSWLGGGDSQSGAAIAEFAEQAVARALASGGGLGLASLVEQGLGRDPSEDAGQTQKLTAPAGTGSAPE